MEINENKKIQRSMLFFGLGLILISHIVWCTIQTTYISLILCLCGLLFLFISTILGIKKNEDNKN